MMNKFLLSFLFLLSISWAINKDPVKAVNTAMSKDGDYVYSGGEIKFLNCNTKETNINTNADFLDIKRSILEKGMVRYMTNDSKPLITLQEASKSDLIIKDIVEKITIGSITANAPSGSDPVIWTIEDENRLDEAFAKRAKKRLSSK